MCSAQQVFRSTSNELSVAKARNKRLGFCVRTQQRKEFCCGVKILSFPLLGPFEFRLSHCWLVPLFKGFSRSCAFASLADRVSLSGAHRLTVRRCIGSPGPSSFPNEIQFVQAPRATCCLQTPASFSGPRFNRTAGARTASGGLCCAGREVSVFAQKATASLSELIVVSACAASTMGARSTLPHR